MKLKRWQFAQDYERSYWEKTANRISRGVRDQLGWYEWKSQEMEKHLSPFMNEDQKKGAKILEIGSGPVGIVSFMRWGERYAVDPLDDFYSSNQTLSHLRDNAVNYSQGRGEKLPFEDGFFSVVILDNVLDHVHNASEVLNEISRVLSADGILYLAVNIHTKWGAFLHIILSKLLIDRGHPYTFTSNGIRDFLLKHKFKSCVEYINDYQKAREQDLRSNSLKSNIKGHVGLSEFIYYSVSSKS